MRARALEPLIQRLSAYGVPIAIGALTLVALVAWEPHYPPGTATPLELRVVEDDDAALEAAQAI